MLITIVGYEQRRNGVSQKTGRAYDFTPVYYTYQAKGVEGLKVGSRNLDAKDLSPANIVLGAVLDFQFDDTGRLMAVFLPD